MKICPKCCSVRGSFYVAFCEFDGTPMVDTASEEGRATIERLKTK